MSVVYFVRTVVARVSILMLLLLASGPECDSADRALATIVSDSNCVSAVFSPNGLWFASAGDDPHVTIREVETGGIVKVLLGHRSTVYCSTFSPDNRWLATADLNGVARIWDTTTWRMRQVMTHQGSIRSLCFSPDSSRICTGTTIGTATFWDVQTGRKQAELADQKPWVSGVAFAPDGHELYLSTGSWEPADASKGFGVSAWKIEGSRDAPTMSLIRQSTRRSHSLESLGVTADGSRLVTASTNGQIVVWKTKTLTPVRTIIHNAAFHRGTLLSGDRLFAAGDALGNIGIWNIESGDQLRLFSGHNSHVFDLAVSPDTQILASASEDDTLKFWSPTSRPEVPEKWKAFCNRLQTAPLEEKTKSENAQELVTTHWNADAKNDIFKIGKFDEPSDLQVPDGWQDVSAFDSGNATLEPRGRGTLSLNTPTDDTDAFIETQIDVPASAKYLTFMVSLRGPTLKRSSQSESGAGVRFTLMKGQVERSFKRVEPSYDGYRNWVFNIQTMQVMPGEDKLRIRVEVTKATGSLDIDSILVVPSDLMNEATIQQQRLLDQAMKSDDPELIQQLIEATPNMLEVRTGQCDNGTPLIRAAWDGAPKVAAMLVKLGADIEAKDQNWGNTPLRWCCWWGTPDVAEVLMGAGAEANGASAMARSSKTSNGFTQRPPEDFDRTAKIIEDHLAKRKPQK